MYNIHIRESRGRLRRFTSVQSIVAWLDIHSLPDSFAMGVRIRSIIEILDAGAGEQVSGEVGDISTLMSLFRHLSDREEIWHYWE